MSRKKKKQRFTELGTFNNVIQPGFEEVFRKPFRLRGKWSTEYFGNDNPVILELGCGKGEYTTGLAQKFPGCNYIGIDIKGARIWSGAKQAVENGLKNVAFIRTRIEFIDSFFGQDEISAIWLTFPDPQEKERRTKKRLTSSRFLAMYSTFLRHDGVIHLKTDSTVLYRYTKGIILKNRLELIEANEDIYNSRMKDNTPA
ncbi:MAG: tRNA (guanosine(46)-N7)-methyltransferase TrmB, partial [Bacteroidetes bacterium]|nr:tRNA (guanosine(46)-N7)-methyltransferase TrmB [Bacteroidota bacterium]